jgi:hypothetical protein
VLKLGSPLAAKLKEPSAALPRLLRALAEKVGRARGESISGKTARTLNPQGQDGPQKVVAITVCLQVGIPLAAEELMRGALRAGYKSGAGKMDFFEVGMVLVGIGRRRVALDSSLE